MMNNQFVFDNFLIGELDVTSEEMLTPLTQLLKTKEKNYRYNKETIAVTFENCIIILTKSQIDNLIFQKLYAEKNNLKIVISEFEFFIDQKGVWLNQCTIKDEYRRNKIGLFMIKEAIKDFGQLLISNIGTMEHKKHKIQNDTRYLTEDGPEFIAYLLRESIIQNNWYVSPF